jgi:hypothetical protein
MRSCECGADISGRHPLATRCESCQKRHRSSGRPRKRKSEAKTRSCRSCGADITGSINTQRLCDTCRAPKPNHCITGGCGAVVRRRGSRCRPCAADNYRAYMARYVREHREQAKGYETVYSPPSGIGIRSGRQAIR